MIAGLLALVVPACASAADSGGVIVRYRAGTTAAERLDTRQDADVTRAGSLPVPRMEVVAPDSGVTISRAIGALERDDNVLYAEPNVTRHALLTPNDSLFGNEWGLSNSGQNVPTSNQRIAYSAAAGDDIDAPAAWDVTTGSANVVVGVVDTGVDSAAGDLAPNIWTNAKEVAGNGADDDNNGFKDDVHGWDFVTNDNSPSDVTAAGGNPGHGTHVSGIVGARGNDGAGVAGVAWSTTILPVRVLDQNGAGSLAQVIAGYTYAARNGARIVNASLGDFSPSQAEFDTINSFPNTLFVVAAGNDGANSDSGDAASCAQIDPATAPSQCSFPCNYDLANVVCVAATNGDDTLASFSNFGTKFVDLAAPGVRIWSTLPSSRCGTPPCFGDLSGTSMSTPFVSGVAALVLAHDPDLTTAQLRQALLTSVDKPPGLAGKLVTDGRLNAAAALAAGDVLAHPPPPPPPPPPPAPAPVTVVAPSANAVDRTAPALTLSFARRARIATVFRTGLRGLARCSERCQLAYDVLLDARTARRLHVPRTVATRNGRLGANATERVTLRLPRALRRARSLTLTVRVRAVDTAGNAVTRTARVSLRR